MDLKRNKPMGEGAIFRIYSMTKPVTGVAFMTLVEKGLITFNFATTQYSSR